MTPVRYVSAARVRDLGRVLSDRDMEIVHSVAQLRFVSGAQLRRMHVTGGTMLGNERVTRRLLARLVALGVLDRLERRIGGPGPAGSDGYIYTLALGGQYLAHKRQMMSRSRRRRPVVPGQMFVGHTLALAELHTRLIEAEREGHWRLLERLAEPSCWRRFATPDGEQSILKPDLSARLWSEDRRCAFLIEVDRGTEGTRTLERRVSTYMQYRICSRAWERQLPQILWLARSDRRVQVIADILDCLPN
ncbi:MAG TPA: replication-relaxation family protein, partial [Solirubrobacteraceae bacterium]